MNPTNQNPEQCFQCGETLKSNLQELYGFTVCAPCKSKLGLMHDGTIRKHQSSYDIAKQMNPHKPSYQEEVEHRLAFMDRDFISRKIKLLHIQTRLKHFVGED